MENMSRFDKPKFSWFQGGAAERCVQFLCYLAAACFVSFIFAPFFK